MTEQTKTSEQIKRFQFFSAEIIQDKPNSKEVSSASLNDIEISSAVFIEPKLFFCSKRKACIYLFENNGISGNFLPYTEALHFINKTSNTDNGYLVTFGVDMEGQIRNSYIKLWDPRSIDFSGSGMGQKLAPIRSILVGKLGNPLVTFNTFAISQDLTAMAFGLIDGSILFFRGKNLLNQDLKENVANQEKTAILNLFFIKDDNNNLSLFYSTQGGLYCYHNLTTKRKLFEKGGLLCDVSVKGHLFYVNPEKDNVMEFDNLQSKNSWGFEGQKEEIKCFKSNYLLVSAGPRTETTKLATNFSIYDLVNNYMAFNQSYSFGIEHIIPTPNQIHLITLNAKGEKQLVVLSEKDNNFKLETFFKRSFFDVALRFARNQNSDLSLLAEISRLHGDHLYAKGDFSNAITQYKSTAGYVEPSYIIRKFLDVSHIEYLITYLEAIHEKRLADKHHTALLLNCYVKQKMIDKLENFLQKSSFDAELFDTETAIKVCRELQYIDLALQLSQQSGYDDLYLRILIEEKKNYRYALEYIRIKLSLEDKIKYIREFGQTLMKNEPEYCLDLIIKLVGISTIQRIKVQQNQTLRNPNSDEIELLKYLNLSIEKDWERLPLVAFPKPDEYMHLFVVNNDQLEKYLCYLKSLKNLPNEKVIFHRLFEYYLEEYVDIYNKNEKLQKHRKIKDIDLQKKENIILDLLKSPEHERKYDENHLLILFKMYHFDAGIVHLCKKLHYTEELMNFYIEKSDHTNVLNLCKEFEGEPNLWVQALKYFSRLGAKEEERIMEILEQIQKSEILSPLLVLNILAKFKNIPFKIMKNFFSKGIEKDKNAIDKDTKIVTSNKKKIEESRGEYQKLKTTAKVFQTKRCANCENQLTLPAVHFMCGHSFHDNCLLADRSDKDCLKCMYENKRILETKEQFDSQANETKAFSEKLTASKNQFDIVAEYLGRGLFKYYK